MKQKYCLTSGVIMSCDSIFLDNASTTPLSEDVKKYIISILDDYGNPSSRYSLGDTSKYIINQARNNVAKFINGELGNIIFTSSGSASNTLAIKGYVQKHNCCTLFSPIAHKSILKCVESCNNYIYPLTVSSDGTIDVCELDLLLKFLKKEAFVIIDYANSEIGTIQDVKAIVDTVHKYGGTIMIDCTGSIPSIPLDIKLLDADIITFSGHKLHALKGVGVLYKKPNIELESLVYGSQENGLFAGTENVLGIASLGKSVESYDYNSISSEGRDYVYNYIINNIKDCYLVGTPLGVRLPHNLYMCFKGVTGESLMTLMDLNGIQISTGSACNNYSLTPSTILTAIGMKEKDINSCVRLTFRGDETKEELDWVCKKLKECVDRLRFLGE